jgi:hypothetical protein
MHRRTVTQLYNAFTTTFHNLKDLEALPHPRSDIDEKRYEAVLNVCTKLAERIVKTRARSIEEMLLKIRAAGWVNGASEPLDRWSSCADLDIVDCLVSIRKDLQTMQAASPPGAARRTVRARVTGKRRRAA